MTRSHRIESNGHVRRCFPHCRRIIIQLFWESVNRFKSYLTNELHKTSSQTLIHIFHHFLTKRLIKNILNRTINNKIIFSCSRGTFLTVLCDKFSIMYVYVIHSDHLFGHRCEANVTSLRDSTFFWFLFLYNILIHNWTNELASVITLTLGPPRWSSRRSRANIVNTTTRHASCGEPALHFCSIHPLVYTECVWTLSFTDCFSSLINHFAQLIHTL